MATQASERLRAMDEQGIDVEALSINPYWYKTDRDLARQIIKVQNEKLAEACAAHPDRFVAFATVALQHPDLAAEQLEEGVKKLGLRGAAIGGSVNGEEISDPKFHPFWAKAEQLGVVVFIHPQGAGIAAEIPKRLKGNGYLENVIGNPLETTIALSHLIFEGTLDTFPGLKICAAHAGGYLPSYAGRSDRGCPPAPPLAPAARTGRSRRRRRSISSRCTTTRWCSRPKGSATSPPRWARVSSWSAPTFRIRGRRPRWISSSARRA